MEVQLPMNPMPLRYNISSWRQLPKCLSNNSRLLHIEVADFIQDNRLSGLRISVVHEVFGVLFAYVVDADGDIVSKSSSLAPSGLSTDQILQELYKYGFIVYYNPRATLPGDQIQYLMTLRDLHFDKIRILGVKDFENRREVHRTYVVAFKIEENPLWLNLGYSPRREEFNKSIQEGSALNISNISDTKKYRWDWLDYVANIDDILKDNAEIQL